MSDRNHPYFPFDSGYFKGKPLSSTCSEDRKDLVAQFNKEQCQAALKNPNLDLQATVRVRIEQRIRRLEKTHAE